MKIKSFTLVNIEKLSLGFKATVKDGKGRIAILRYYTTRGEFKHDGGYKFNIPNYLKEELLKRV